MGVDFIGHGLDSLADGVGVVENAELEIFVGDDFFVVGCHRVYRFCFGDYNEKLNEAYLQFNKTIEINSIKKH